MIFVFGSNQAGRHGKGAALYARQHHDAEYGVGEGMTGNSYALPTKDEYMRTRSLRRIKRSVDRFIGYASDNPSLQFEVTKVGCGLAGYNEEDISPMFKDAPSNCVLPEGW
tara:strand:+ start:457 stop:789 length:333 start_codon:yes stop_codon:yes gene_type:complete